MESHSSKTVIVAAIITGVLSVCAAIAPTLLDRFLTGSKAKGKNVVDQQSLKLDEDIKKIKGNVKREPFISGVKKIRITANENSGYMQISEIVIKDVHSGEDLALANKGANVSVSSTYPGTYPEKVIDGIGPAAFPQIWHSAGATNEFLEIQLPEVADVSEISVMGRADTWGLRDKFTITLFDSLNNTIKSDINADATIANHTARISLKD